MAATQIQALCPWMTRVCGCPLTPICQIRAVEIQNNGLPCVCTLWIYCCFIIITNINKNCVADKNSAVHCSKQPPGGTMLHYKHPTWKKTFVLIVIKQLTINTNAFSFKGWIWNWRMFLISQSNTFFHYHSRVLTFMSTHAPRHPSLLPLKPIFSLLYKGQNKPNPV